MRRPKPLQKGDTVALVGASGPVPEGRLEPSVRAVEAMGLKAAVFQSCLETHGYLSGTDEVRAADLQRAFADPAVAGVLCLRGGYGAQRLLPRLDYDAIAANPKPFVGYSDVTALHTVLTQRCGFITYHAPMPATEWWAGLDHYTRAGLESCLFDEHLPRRLENPGGAALEALSPGRAEGRLTGGNLSLLASALGTPFEVDTKGKILFLEEIDEEPYRIDRMLLQLKWAGKFRDCAGVLLGAFTNCEAKAGCASLALRDVLQELLPDEGKPTVWGLQCGHILPTMSLPMGARVSLTAGPGGAAVAILS